MGLLGLIALVIIAAWICTAVWFTGLLKRPEHSPLRQIANYLLAWVGATVLVLGVSVAVFAAVCSGIRW